MAVATVAHRPRHPRRAPEHPPRAADQPAQQHQRSQQEHGDQHQEHDRRVDGDQAADEDHDILDRSRGSRC